VFGVAPAIVQWAMRLGNASMTLNNNDILQVSMKLLHNIDNVLGTYIDYWEHILEGHIG